MKRKIAALSLVSMGLFVISSCSSLVSAEEYLMEALNRYETRDPYLYKSVSIVEYAKTKNTEMKITTKGVVDDYTIATYTPAYFTGSGDVRDYFHMSKNGEISNEVYYIDGKGFSAELSYTIKNTRLYNEGTVTQIVKYSLNHKVNENCVLTYMKRVEEVTEELNGEITSYTNLMEAKLDWSYNEIPDKLLD